ncbi:MAG: uroporphyrinogen-III synthase [Anaerolineales bacterium]|nr:uroporphyrinogen-III synthase [Anaerolineales bacterium]
MPSLAGKRVVVTRERSQAGEMAIRLAEAGAVPIVFPTIEIAPMADLGRLDHALHHLDSYDWVVFTSQNGVRIFWERWSRLASSADSSLVFPPDVRVAAIGPGTAAAIRERGGRVDLVPNEYIAEALVEGLQPRQGLRVLLPRAESAREALVDGLVALGARVEEIPTYRTLPAAPDRKALAELARGVDAITFTSSSTVRNFVELVGRVRSPDRSRGFPLGSAVIACLGPITASTATSLGLPVDVTAEEYTIDGLVRALEKHFSTPQPDPKEKRWLSIRPG